MKEVVNFILSEDQKDKVIKQLESRLDRIILNKVETLLEEVERSYREKYLANKEWYNSKETAEYLGISENSLSNYVSAGLITYYKRDMSTGEKHKNKKYKKGLRDFHKKDLDIFRQKHNVKVECTK
jgi:hypothetical protein